MKKSDAAKKLLDYVNSNPCPEKDEDAAIAIIDFLVNKCGMLPPVEPDNANDYTYPNLPDWEQE